MSEKFHRGFIILSRDLMDSSMWHLSPDHLRVAIYLLLKARHSQKSVALPDGTRIHRGELVTSMHGIAENCIYFDNRANREYSRKKVLNILENLEKVGFIKRNSHSKGTHITICNYDIYQNVGNYNGNTNETVREQSGNSEGTVRDTNNKGNNEKNEKKDSSCAEPQSGSPPQDSVLCFPCTGPVKEWHLTQSKLSEYAELYETMDVMAECRKALQWIRDNPSRRKTARGMTKFLGGWLGRAVDRGGAQKQQAPEPDFRGYE